MNQILERTTDTAHATPVKLQRGMRLGHYLLRRLIENGGMSSVYLAYDELTYHTVAIKVVEHYEDEETALIHQFRREVRIMHQLKHPHILPMLDAGRQGPWYYLVMPYMQGGTLQDHINQGPLSPDEAGLILDQLASALDYVHAHGIIHRDMKPGNILLDEDGNVYLADFGIATQPGENTIARSRHVTGTPIYMAPELCYGHASERSDIYALGIMLYQMLTGVVPFEGYDLLEICRKQIEEQPIHPSYFNSMLSRPIEQVILRSIEKEPEQRFATAQLFADKYYEAYNTVTLTDKARNWFRYIETQARSVMNQLHYVDVDA